MSKYTTEVRFICETAAGLDESKGYTNIEAIIAAARPKIFDFSYPLFDQNYKSVIETKILRHFYTREIGAETVGLWKHFLSRKLNEIMPYYNKLYQSELLDFNPFYDTDLTRDHKKDGSGTNTTETVSDGSSDEWVYRNDTPQGGIQGLQSLEYLSSADHNAGDVDNTVNVDGAYTDTESYLEHVKGKGGGASYSAMLKEYRETFLNIDLQIIDELEPLFMGLW